MTYVLVNGLRRLALQAADLAQATCATIRRMLFKIGALVSSVSAASGSAAGGGRCLRPYIQEGQ
jgi:hypothetical protein